jgi:hypothetical protein
MACATWPRITPQTQNFSYDQNIFVCQIRPKHFRFLWFLPSLVVRRYVGYPRPYLYVIQNFPPTYRSLVICIPEVSWFGYYMKEWKNFPSLLEALEHFWGIVWSEIQSSRHVTCNLSAIKLSSTFIKKVPARIRIRVRQIRRPTLNRCAIEA